MTHEALVLRALAMIREKQDDPSQIARAILVLLTVDVVLAIAEFVM